MRLIINGAVMGILLFIPIYYTNPILNLESLTAYYLAGFIFVEALLLLLNDVTKRKKPTKLNF